MHLIRCLRPSTDFLIDLPSIPKLLAIYIQASQFFLVSKFVFRRCFVPKAWVCLH